MRNIDPSSHSQCIHVEAEMLKCPHRHTHTHTCMIMSHLIHTHRGPGWSPSSVTGSRRPVSVQWATLQCGGLKSDTGRTSAAGLCSSGTGFLRWVGAVWPAQASVLCKATAPLRGRSKRCLCCHRCMSPPWSCSGRSWRWRCKQAPGMRVWQGPSLCRWDGNLKRRFTKGDHCF